MYHKKVISEFLNPKNVGIIRKPSSRIEYEDKECGSVIKLFLQIENNKVIDAKFKAYGGPVTIAGCSVATSIMLGSTLKEVEEICYEQILVELVSVPEEKIVCIKAIVKAIEEALTYYYKKQQQLQKKKK